MALEISSQRPARMSIANMTTGDSIEAQFNPTEFEETLDVNWARLTVPGLSHQPLQFINTGNAKFGIELYFDAASLKGDSFASPRRFLQSLCYPKRGAQDVIGGGPPRALFIWPEIISLSCVLTALSFKHTRFNVEGAPTQYTAKVSLEEIRDVRLLSEDVLANGTARSGAARNGA